MNCKEAKLLLLPHIANDEDITVDERHGFEQHLQSCAQCVEEYEESKSLIKLVKEYWPLYEDMLSRAENPNQPTKCYMTVEEGWQDLCRRCPDLAQPAKLQKYLQLLYKVGAVAACLVIGMTTWLIFSLDSKPKIKQEIISQQVAFDPFLTVELVSDSDKTVIPIGKELKTSIDESKTLIVNDKHKLVMNADTTLLIKPLIINEDSGCTVELLSGQIYSHVECDGNPFIVKTSHGRAVITGTTFDVKVTDDSTTLIVSEGSVQFESERGAVTVEASQISSIVGQSAPTEPRAYNTARLTAWAASNQVEIPLTNPNLHAGLSGLDDLGLPIRSGLIDLEAIDYESWVEKKRDWFKREYPWIFQLKEALRKEDMNTDYPQLLMQSDYIWQFVYPESSAPRIAVINFKLLLKTVHNYDLDKRWLFRNVPAVRYAFNKHRGIKDNLAGIQAFEQWSVSFEKALKSPDNIDHSTIFRSFHAATYLVNTRTLLWLCINNDISASEVEDGRKLLSLLNQEIQAADRCVQTAVELMALPEKTCLTKDDPVIERMIKEINVISELEKVIFKLK